MKPEILEKTGGARSIRDLEDEIVLAFNELQDWMDKYAFVIRMGRSLKAMDPDLKTQANAIAGCQSKVWIACEVQDGKMSFYAESDALIVKGLIALLLHVLDQQPPEVIVEAKLDFIERIGLHSNLSPSRANGLGSIIKQIKHLAERALETSSSGDYPGSYVQ
jgi:cysteine desulfuration protein SufE